MTTQTESQPTFSERTAPRRAGSFPAITHPSAISATARANAQRLVADNAAQENIERTAAIIRMLFRILPVIVLLIVVAIGFQALGHLAGSVSVSNPFDALSNALTAKP